MPGLLKGLHFESTCSVGSGGATTVLTQSAGAQPKHSAQATGMDKSISWRHWGKYRLWVRKKGSKTRGKALSIPTVHKRKAPHVTSYFLLRLKFSPLLPDIFSQGSSGHSGEGWGWQETDSPREP